MLKPVLYRRLVCFLLPAIIVLLDQSTKYLARLYLDGYQALALSPGVNLLLTYNQGAAFGLLNSAGGWQRWFFSVIALASVMFLVIWIRHLSPGQKLSRYAMLCLIGGAIGNLIDRVLFGRVTDFIDLYLGNWHWPTFNVADSVLCLAVMILCLDLVDLDKKKKQPQQENHCVN